MTDSRRTGWLRKVFVAGAVLAAAGAVAVFVWKLPSRWKDDRTPPPGFQRALEDFDELGMQAGLDRLGWMRRRWTHPLWNARSDFLTGYWSHRLKRYEVSARALRRLADPRRGSALAGRAATIRASALIRLDRHGQAIRCLQPHLGPLDGAWTAPRTAELWAEAQAGAGGADEAIDRLERWLAGEPPQGTPALQILAAEIHARAGDHHAAARWFKSAYCSFPNAPEADEALASLESLPGTSPAWTLDDLPLLDLRAANLAGAGDVEGAAKSWGLARRWITGGEGQPELIARHGIALAAARRDDEARGLLEALPEEAQSAPEVVLARAAMAARRGRRWKTARILKPLFDSEIPPALRSEAELILAGAEDDSGNRAAALRHYSAALARVEPSPETDQAVWRAGWLASEAGRHRDALRFFERLDRPDSHPGHQAASVYWRARTEERLGNRSAARTLLEETADRFRNDYYGIRADVRLGRSAPPSARPLKGVKYAAIVSPRTGLAADGAADAPAPDPAGFPPPADGAVAAAGELEILHLPGEAFNAYAFALRFRPDDRPLRLRLADLALTRGERIVAIPHIRAAYPGLLSEPRPQIPPRHGEALYPLDSWDAIVASSLSRSLDPFLVSALILQESAHDPLAVSRAGALGLMQIMPRTGRDLARRERGGRFEREDLFDPEFNIALGTSYLADLLGRYDGHVEPALAAYNAGTSRVDRWWPRAGRDAEIFVERIPFTETRLYVKRVLAHRRMYVALYERRGRGAS